MSSYDSAITSADSCNLIHAWYIIFQAWYTIHAWYMIHPWYTIQAWYMIHPWYTIHPWYQAWYIMRPLVRCHHLETLSLNPILRLRYRSCII